MIGFWQRRLMHIWIIAKPQSFKIELSLMLQCYHISVSLNMYDDLFDGIIEG